MRTHGPSQRGIALVTVMLITVAVSALIAGAILLTGSSKLISKGQESEEEMRNAADAGIELGRSALNGGAVVMDTIYHALATNQSVYDANGTLIPGVTRSVYYGPTGSTTGQYGVFGSVVSVITNQAGAVVVRRGELAQESFAKFAYFTDNEGNGICFGGGDNIFGPMHSNDNVCIYSTGVHFHSTVEVGGAITGKNYGLFDAGYTEHGTIIPMPTITQLNTLLSYANAGGMAYTEPAGGSAHRPRMRIQFVALDLDGDGKVTGPDEGFYRVYVDTGAVNTDQMIAARINRPDTNSYNCGHYHGSVFFTARQHYKQNLGTIYGSAHTGSATPSTAAGQESLTSNSTGAYQCWMAGDEHLNVATAPLRNTFLPADQFGRWLQYTTTPDPRIIPALKNVASGTVDTTLANRTILANYLFPLARSININTKGVLFVTGRVILSGTLNAKLTVAATGQIMIGDDLKYAIAPGSAPCASANILGLISQDSILMADNTINAPWDYTNGAQLDPNNTARNYGRTTDETVQAVILTLASFGTENYANGGTSQQPCNGTAVGRGCLALTGGLIQEQRGAVGTSGQTGYTKRYAYDICAFQTPPPYFPTTGRYDRNRYYEIDPVGFNVANFYTALKP